MEILKNVVCLSNDSIFEAKYLSVVPFVEVPKQETYWELFVLDLILLVLLEIVVEPVQLGLLRCLCAQKHLLSGIQLVFRCLVVNPCLIQGRKILPGLWFHKQHQIPFRSYHTNTFVFKWSALPLAQVIIWIWNYWAICKPTVSRTFNFRSANNISWTIPNVPCVAFSIRSPNIRPHSSYRWLWQ